MTISNYLKSTDEGTEKHCPYITATNCQSCGELSVTIQVGKDVIHPSTSEHSIKTITLYGVTDNDKLEQLSVFQLGDDRTVPSVRTSVKKEKYKKLLATSYCNLHGLWESEIDLL